MKDLLARLNLDAIADLIRAGRAAESAATALLHAQPANVEAVTGSRRAGSSFV